MKPQQLTLICAGCGEVIEKLNPKLDVALCDDCVFWADTSLDQIVETLDCIPFTEVGK